MFAGSNWPRCHRDIACCCTPTVAHRSSCFITCAVCSKSFLVACLQNQSKQTVSLAAKYTCSTEWLQGFIVQCDLKYSCQENKQKSHDSTTIKLDGNSAQCLPQQRQGNITTQLHNEIASLQSSFMAISTSANQIAQQMSELKSSLLPASDMSLSRDEQMSEMSSISSKQATYTSIVSKSISETVKKVVTDSIKVRNSLAREKCSIVIYGLPEKTARHS